MWCRDDPHAPSWWNERNQTDPCDVNDTPTHPRGGGGEEVDEDDDGGSGVVVGGAWRRVNATDENRCIHHAYDRLLRISIAGISTPKG
ncbi:hypothetical protein Tco_1539923, partial [Tanacetum coccineum]